MSFTELTPSRIKELREEHADYIAQKRHDAEAAVLLMEQSVSAKAQAERRKNGLVILSAYYGRGAAFTAKGMVEDEAIIDVTVPIQALVQNSRIHIPAGAAKFNLLGFWVSLPVLAELTPGSVHRRAQETARALSLPRRRA